MGLPSYLPVVSSVLMIQCMLTVQNTNVEEARFSVSIEVFIAIINAIGLELKTVFER